MNDYATNTITPERIPRERFDDAEAAVAHLELIYEQHTTFLREQFARLLEVPAICRGGSARPIRRS